MTVMWVLCSSVMIEDTGKKFEINRENWGEIECNYFSSYSGFEW